MSQKPDGSLLRSCTFDRFEDRIVMSGEPLTASLITTHVMPDLSTQGEIVETSGDQFGLNSIRDNYDLDGKGQTVAIIDTGIAWDHYALGSGLGAGHKVVGGWDFAENDANPYDDGPAGYHGTHVSGIVASDAIQNLGVAPGADLVGLRVFDDSGFGKLEWVEKALQWVHNHKDTFANPITTINLSLGGNWNASTNPDWAILEEEFAQLKSDGIFISVAAGNSFQQYLTKGLSYPAVSPNVVAVSSHGTDGLMSDFSQRADRVLVAPGEDIRSTVPDHLFHNGKTGQFLTATGTSMAAPYVAGASVLLREAFGFMGDLHVDQQKIYDRLFATADKVYDQITGGWYSHINLQKAIESVMVDDYGSNWASANKLGILPGSITVQGSITSHSDVDTFAFTAGKTGTVTISFETTDEMQALVKLANGSATWNGNKLTFNVVAGTEYKFSVETAAGCGHYKFTAQVTAATNAINLGNAFYSQYQNQTVAGEKLYQLAAGRDGILTVAGENQIGNVTFEIFDANMKKIGSSAIDGNGSRLDVEVQEGNTYFLRAIGNGTTSFQVANLVSLDEGNLTIHGTNQHDTIEITKSNKFEFTVNTLAYEFSNNQITSVNIYAHAGADSLKMTVNDTGKDVVSIGPGSIQASGSGYELFGNGFHSIVVYGGGTDQLIMSDSAGDDVATRNGEMVTLKGAGFSNFAIGFKDEQLIATTGRDILDLKGSMGDDKFAFRNGKAWMQSQSLQHVASNFDEVHFDGKGGEDLANLFDTVGDDQFELGPNSAHADLSNAQVVVDNVARINAFANGGNDQVILNDSAGNDTFTQNLVGSTLSGIGFVLFTSGFDRVTVNSTDGNDLGQLKDSAMDDTVSMSETETRLLNSKFETIAKGFDRINIIAAYGGDDSVSFFGTQSTDAIYSQEKGTSFVTSGGVLNRAVGFEVVRAFGSGGNDVATVIASDGNKSLFADNNGVRLQSSSSQLTIKQFEEVKFDGHDRLAEIVFADFSDDDVLIGSGNQVEAQLGNTKITAKNFDLLNASANVGSIAQYEIGLVDYLFMLDGTWSPR